MAQAAKKRHYLQRNHEQTRQRRKSAIAKAITSFTTAAQIPEGFWERRWVLAEFSYLWHFWKVAWKLRHNVNSAFLHQVCLPNNPTSLRPSYYYSGYAKTSLLSNSLPLSYRAYMGPPSRATWEAPPHRSTRSSYLYATTTTA